MAKQKDRMVPDVVPVVPPNNVPKYISCLRKRHAPPVLSLEPTSDKRLWILWYFFLVPLDGLLEQAEEVGRVSGVKLLCLSLERCQCFGEVVKWRKQVYKVGPSAPSSLEMAIVYHDLFGVILDIAVPGTLFSKQLASRYRG